MDRSKRGDPLSLYLHLTSDVTRDKGPIYARIQEFLEHGGFERRVLYLVPDDKKLASEFEVLKQLNRLKGKDGHEANAMMRLQVLGLRRLAWFLGLNVPKQTISDTGLAMVLKKLTKTYQDQLVIFQRESCFLSFQEQLVQLFSELERGNISAAALQAMVEQMAPQVGDSSTHQHEWQKMKEIALIYAGYEAYLQAHPLRDLTIYDRLVTYIQTHDFSHTLVVLDGFERLHAYEYQVIQSLLAAGVEMIATFTLPEGPTNDTISPQDLFYAPKRLRQQLAQMNGGTYQKLAPQSFTASSAYARGFAVLERWLIQEQQGTFTPQETADVQDAVSLWKSESPQVEADQVANQIYHLVSAPHSPYRYQDFQIFVRDFDHYQTVLLPALEQNQIPYFVDFPQSMAKHPLVRFMDSLQRIYRRNWRYQDVFNLLRTELLAYAWADEEAFTYRQTVDSLENVVVAHGYQGKRFWNEDVHWDYQVDPPQDKKTATQEAPIDNAVRLLRNQTVAALNALFQAWDQATSGAEAIRALYHFLTTNQVQTQIQTWANQLAAKGNIEEAEHQTQVWQKFVETLDEYVQLFGTDPFDCDAFFEILASAFAQTTYRIVPPTVDSVTITDYTGVALTPKKVAFVMGLTDQTLPRKQAQFSLLTDDDRALLDSYLAEDQALNPTPTEQFNHEKLVAYHLFLAATEHLYLSYPYNRLDEKETKPSPYLPRLAAAFQLKTVIKAEEGDFSAGMKAGEVPQLVLGNWQTQLHHLVIKERQAKQRQAPLAPTWQAIEQRLLNSQTERTHIQTVLGSLTYTNTVKSLTPALAHKLYGQTLVASVSNLELYNRDPFSYFLQYGLRLQERARFEIDQRLTGSYSHEVMQRYYDRWLQYPDESLTDRFQTVIAAMAQQPAYAIFNREPLFAFQQRQLDRTLKQTLQREATHQEKVILENWYNEWTFGQEQLALAIPSENPVLLRGKIDRVDAIWQIASETNEPTLYFDVIDYKSSLSHRVSQLTNLGSLYDGTSLQLYTYLAVVWEAFRQQQYWKKAPQTDSDVFETWPIGIFYDELSSLANNSALVIDSEATWSRLQQMQGQNPEQERPDIIQLGRMNGYILESLAALKDISQTKSKDDGYLSAEDVYRFKTVKTGGFSNRAGLTNRLTKAQFEAIVRFVKAKIATTVDAIQSGLIPLRPIADDPYLPSLTTFKSVARYDATDTDIPRRPQTTFNHNQAITDFFQRIAADETSDSEKSTGEEDTNE